MPIWKRLFTAEAPIQRKKLSVAFLDTGISPVADFTHPENRIAAFLDLINGRTDPYDDNGHGTHVTGSPIKRKNPLFLREEGVFRSSI